MATFSPSRTILCKETVSQFEAYDALFIEEAVVDAYGCFSISDVIIYDQAKFDQSVLENDREGWPVFLAYGWYLYHAMSPDLHAIRYVRKFASPFH